MWSDGFIENIEFQIKYFDEGSQYGIGGGRISKLFMRAGYRVLASYDRGWDISPDMKDEATATAYREIIGRYN